MKKITTVILIVLLFPTMISDAAILQNATPTQKEYFDIVLHLARRAGVTLPDEELRAEANKWELSHGGISGRTAEQFVSYLASQPDAFK